MNKPLAFLHQRHGHVNVKWFGVMGDSMPIDMTQIEAAIAYLTGQGGGQLYFPSGDYLLGLGSATAAAILVEASNIRLVGDGVGATTFHLADNQDCHVVSFNGLSGLIGGCGLTDIGIDGNRANQTAGHGVRFDNVADAECGRFHIQNVASYGIGAQGGAIKNLHIHHGLIEDVGSDGIDFKNKLDANEANFLDHLRIRRFGLNPSVDNQAGIDCRGVVHSNQVHVSEPPQDGTGVRFRQGETSDVNGIGGHNSTLSEFDMDMGSAANAIGVASFARNVSISKGSSKGGVRGLGISELFNSADAVHVTGTTGQAFYLTENGDLKGEHAILTACVAHDNAGYGLRANTKYAEMHGLRSIRNAKGIRVDTTSVDAKFFGGRATDNTDYNYSNAGVNTETWGLVT